MAEQEFTTEELANEIWKPIAGYEGYYSVSNLGRVRRDADGIATRKGRILKPNPTTGGYVRVSLSVANRIRNVRIHTLVTRMFMGEPPLGLMANHKDLDKTNNRLSNFEYITSLENKHHAMRNGHESRGSEHGNLVRAKTPRGNLHYAQQSPVITTVNGRQRISKLTSDQVQEIRALLKNGSTPIISIARQYCVSRSTVFRIRDRKRWAHISDAH